MFVQFTNEVHCPNGNNQNRPLKRHRCDVIHSRVRLVYVDMNL